MSRHLSRTLGCKLLQLDVNRVLEYTSENRFCQLYFREQQKIRITTEAVAHVATPVVGMDAVRRIEARPGRDAQGVTQEGDAYLVEARLKHRKQAEVQSARRTPKLQSDW